MAVDSQSCARLPQIGDEHTLYIVDLSGYLFRAYYALPPLSTSQGEPTHAVLGVISMIFKLVNECRPALLAVALDSKSKCFRHALYEAYKATRRETPPDLGQQMARVRQFVDAYGIAVYQKEGFEADDVIATVVKQAAQQGFRVVVVSADKDLLQLVGDQVVMFDTMRNAVFGPAETAKKLGVGPAQIRDFLALVGDSSDNIPGVPSVGPKTAVDLLTRYGDLDGIFANLDQLTKKALREKLRAHQPDAVLSRQLVTLRDDLDLVFDAREARFESRVSPALLSLCQELEFTRILARIGGSTAPSEAAAVDQPPGASSSE
jgi:DNA polymerase I